MRRTLATVVLLAMPGCAAVPTEQPPAAATIPEIQEIDLRQAQVFCFEKGGILAAVRIDKDGDVVAARCVPLHRAERNT